MIIPAERRRVHRPERVSHPFGTIGSMYRDRERQRAAERRWYEANKAKVAAKKDRKRERLREMVRRAKEVPCLDCGVRYPYYVMDLDHVTDDKAMIVSKLVNFGATERLRAEIAKYEAVCANCHREREPCPSAGGVGPGGRESKRRSPGHLVHRTGGVDDDPAPARVPHRGDREPDGFVEIALQNVVLWVKDQRRRRCKGRPSLEEALANDFGTREQDDLDERATSGVGDGAQPIGEVRKDEELRHDDVVSELELAPSERDPELSGNGLRLGTGSPTTERASERVDLDNQRERPVTHQSMGHG